MKEKYCAYVTLGRELLGFHQALKEALGVRRPTVGALSRSWAEECTVCSSLLTEIMLAADGREESEMWKQNASGAQGSKPQLSLWLERSLQAVCRPYQHLSQAHFAGLLDLSSRLHQDTLQTPQSLPGHS
ncbi:unnamed protein product [Rangifer tarandus platyrhynchus]|uniref:Uncharacterized protein n=1 Tax=Rangifer tarandus platyrhynchus TaxID=3082113 RepID=A0ABN9A5F5_RANTA|nr:unnamed protein product [Rangifer tarandus platyrhynchus]